VTAADDGIAFGVLGPLEARRPLGPVRLPGARQRVVLAALLLRLNGVVSIDDLIDGLWPDRSPVTARDQVLTVVSTLRRLLGDTERPVSERLIETRSPGYLLRLEPGQVDAHRFETLVRDADQAAQAGRLPQAVTTLRDALALWRGPAFADVSAPFATIAAQRLAELRISAVERLVEVEMQLGRHSDLVPELTRLVAEHPLREGLRGQLMVALHAVGRKAEALETYRAGRQLMVGELGVEPGAELQRIERAVLADDDVQTPAGGAARRHRAAPAPTGIGNPAQLPPDVTDFTGRGDEVDGICVRLTGRSDRATSADDTPAGREARSTGMFSANGAPVATALPVVVINGKAGVGKSALATRVGHLVRTSFPDGQLHVGLRGTQPRPRDPAEALVQLIVALGAPRALIPNDLEERVRLYRTLTAHRRVLVVLDDAGEAAQVRPLLPGGAGCAVVVTGRVALTDLAGAYHVPLDVLPGDEALALLTAVVGPDRVAAETSAAERIIDLCGRLPLAVRIAGAKLAVRRHWSLEKLAERLADQRRRLDELRVGDLEVRASLELSFRALDPDAGVAARHLALLDAPSFTAWAAAAVLGVPVSAAEDLIDRLVERQILEYAGRVAGQSRYRFHDLIRLCLRERGELHDPEPVRLAVVVHGLRAWLAYGLVAMRGLPAKQFPGLEHAIPDDLELDPAAWAAAATDPLGWYEAESDAVLAGVQQAFDLGLDELCTALVHVVGPFLEMRGLMSGWARATELAVRAAHRAGDPRLEALAALYRSRAEEAHAVHRAVESAQVALELFERLGDDSGTAHALNRLSYLYGHQGQLVSARHAAERALDMAGQVGSVWCRARALHHLGVIEREHSRIAESERHLVDAVRLYELCECPSSQADAMKALARTCLAGGHIERATRLLSLALSFYRQQRDPVRESLAMTRLAEAYEAGGRSADAIASAQQALAVATAAGHCAGAGAALSALARLHQGAGRLAEAEDCLGQALMAWRDNGDRWTGTVQLGLGDVRELRGDHEGAVAAWREASLLLHAVAHPSAEEADARLAAHLPVDSAPRLGSGGATGHAGTPPAN
jgi:DNA-binding SARP family transcriptional activator/tetratricopeptide (TPR) repeat protein